MAERKEKKRKEKKNPWRRSRLLFFLLTLWLFPSLPSFLNQRTKTSSPRNPRNPRRTSWSQLLSVACARRWWRSPLGPCLVSILAVFNVWRPTCWGHSRAILMVLSHFISSLNVTQLSFKTKSCNFQWKISLQQGSQVSQVPWSFPGSKEGSWGSPHQLLHCQCGVCCQCQCQYWSQ